jgi:amino acid adenylation domain-containing protein
MKDSLKEISPLQFIGTPRGYQQLSLSRLLKHVWHRSPFYRDFYSNHGIKERDLSELGIRDLPFLTKSILMDNFDRAVTDPRLKRAELEHWIQNNPNPTERFSDSFIVIHSSGTSGTLGIFVYSPREWLMADIAIASRLPKPENSSSERTRAAFYAAAHGHFAMVSMAAALDKSRYDAMILSLLDSRELNTNLLNSFQPHRIYGYASSVTALAEMSLEGSLQICPSEVFVGGDKLSPAMITKIRNAWNGLIFDTYGASESKYIAVKESGDPEMAILDELNIVEVLNDQNGPVSSGQEGRVVLTNLYNYTLPLLRYESGDYVVAGETNFEGLPTSILDIRGRVNDALPVALRNGVYDTIHPILLSEFHVPGIEKIQFISRQPEFVELNYIAPSDLDSAIYGQFQKMLDSKGATNTRFEVKRLKEIENNSQTGKFDLVKIRRSQSNGASSNGNGTKPAFRVLDGTRTTAESSALGTKTELDPRCIHQLFEQQAKQTPDAVAVVCGESRLSYSQLNSKANQLAHHLRAIGVGPGTVVAICVTRGPHMVVGILGILKAGATWLPLDPRHPKARIQTVLEDANAPFLLSESSVISGLPEFAAKAVLIDGDSSSIALCSETELDDSDPANLAYMMFTSGSTGQPKGVMVTHANLCQYVGSMRAALGVTSADTYLHTATIAFSSSVRQLFLPLTCGASVLIATTEQIQEPLSLFEIIRDRRVTVLDLVPTYWRNCIDALSALEPSIRKNVLNNDVRLVATASEVLLSDLPMKWRQEFGHGSELINMFGQTETTGIATTYTIPKDANLEIRTVPIGKPISNMSLYLLDDQQRLVPAGSVGEIHIGGPCVGRGYLNRAELTAERFVRNPFSNDSGSRLYKTGDLGRFRPDGNVEFRGRIDDQVKIRGIRIEPGEVTAVLNEYSGLKESVVVAREDELNNRRLVAYIVPVNGKAPLPQALRAFLGEKLPEYMIPSAFVELVALPRLPSGKIDRQGLPAPDHARLDSGQPFVAPRNDLEKQLVGIWQTVLAVANISMTDNFFDVGGNSLSAMYLLTNVNKTFGEKLPLAALYQAPTVEEFAKLLDHHERSVILTSLLPLQPRGSKPPLFWIHGETSNTLLPHYLGADQPVYGLGHQSLDGIPAQFTTVETIAAHYLEEIRTVQRSGPYFLGGYCFGGLVAFEIAHQLNASGDDVAMLAIIEPSPLKGCGQSDLKDKSVPAPESNKSGIREESARHFNTLKSLGFWQQLEYLGIRVWGKLRQSMNPITVPLNRQFKRAVCAYYIRSRHPLPVWVRSFYILQIYGRARRSYAVRTYSGKVDLFVQEPEFALQSSWDGLCTVPVKIHKVAASNHTAILQQPHFRDWAERLKETLQKAQVLVSRN